MKKPEEATPWGSGFIVHIVSRELRQVRDLLL
jgi:hypothetical protein